MDKNILIKGSRLKMLKRFTTILCILALSFALIPNAKAAIPAKPMDVFFVNDYANVIDSTEELRMVEIGTELMEKTGAQVVAVTINFLDGKAIDDYATELFNKWGIGQADKNNGAMFLLSVGDRETRIQAGTGLESLLTGSVTGKLLDDYAIDSFSKQEYSIGMAQGYVALCQTVAQSYGVSLNSMGNSNVKSNYSNNQPVNDTRSESNGMPSWLIIIIVISIINSMSRRSRRGRSGGFWPGMFGGFIGSQIFRNSGHGGSPFGGGFGGHKSGGGFGGGPKVGGGGSSRGGGGSRKF